MTVRIRRPVKIRNRSAGAAPAPADRGNEAASRRIC